MFLECSDFVRSLLLVRPAVGMVWWRNETELAGALAALGEAVKHADTGAQVLTVGAEGMDGSSARIRLMETIQGADAECTWLFVAKIEQVLSVAATVLNGAREQLGRFRGVVVFVREDRRSEFQCLCPDLMDWVGLRIWLASQPGRPLGFKEIDESLRRLESQYGLPSGAYLADPSVVEAKSPRDARLWKELLTIRSELSTEEPIEQ